MRALLARLILMAFAVPLFAADADLGALRSTLSAIRNTPAAARGPRGTTAEMTVAKHQLRDWVDERLRAFEVRGDKGALVRTLNAELRAAGLLEALLEASRLLPGVPAGSGPGGTCIRRRF